MIPKRCKRIADEDFPIVVGVKVRGGGRVGRLRRP